MSARHRHEYRTVVCKGVASRVAVERRSLPPIRMALVNASYIVTGGARRVECEGFMPGPLSREVSRLLRGQPECFPRELRSDR